MGLTKDLEAAFLKSMGDPEDKGNVPGLAEDLSKAIIDFLQKQEFNITKMKAIVQLEKLSTSGDLSANVKSTVQTIIPASTIGLPAPPTAGSPPNPVPIPLNVSTMTGAKGVIIPKLRLKSKSGQGGNMDAVGYAYIGAKNPVSPSESNETKTTVKLVKVKRGTE